MFDNINNDYTLYPINNQQYQSFSDKILLPLNKYLDKIRSELIKLMNDRKVKLVASSIFRSIKSPNDKTTLCIKSKNTIDEIFDQLIEKHEVQTNL